MKLDTIFNKAGKVASDIKSKVIRINNEFAHAVLTNLNNSNRPLSKSVAKLYANELLRGQWKCNGEPIIFSVDSEGNEHLISGQHRLTAIQLAQQAIDKGEEWPNAQTELDTVVIFGVEHDTADTVDTGKARNHNDVLFRDSWVDSVIPDEWNETVNKRKTWTKTLAGAARLVWLIEGGATVSSAPKFLISEMLDFLQNRHPYLAESVTMVLNADDADGNNGGLKMSLPYLAALCYAASLEMDGDTPTINTEITDKLDMFINQLAVGTGFEKGDPAWALTGYWNALTKEKGSKDRDREWVGPFVKATRAMLEGRTGLKVSDVKLTKKEFDGYNDFPPLFDGWHTYCFEHCAAVKAAASATPEPSSEVVPEATDEDGWVDDSTNNAGDEVGSNEGDGDDVSDKPSASKPKPRPRKRPSKKASSAV